MGHGTQKFLNQVENKTKVKRWQVNGYIPCQGDNTLYDKEKRHWNLYIAIDLQQLDIQNKLKQAAEIVAKNCDGMEFECLILNNPAAINFQQPVAEQIGWDNTQPTFSSTPQTTQDFHGKEIRISIRYNVKNDRYEKAPEELKTLILALWKALQEAGIQLGHVAPLGCQALTIENAYPTPFFCAPQQASDHPGPFTEVIFTRADIETITSTETLMQLSEARTAYHNKHLQNKLEKIRAELDTLKTQAINQKPLSAILWELNKALSNELLPTRSQFILMLAPRIEAIDQDSVQKQKDHLNKQLNFFDKQHHFSESNKPEHFDEYIKTLIGNFPRQADNSYHPEIEKINALLDAEDTTQMEILTQYRKLEKALPDELKALLEKFSSNSWMMGKLTAWGIVDDQLENLVNINPAYLQLLYQRLLSCQQEEVLITAHQSFQLQPTAPHPIDVPTTSPLTTPQTEEENPSSKTEQISTPKSTLATIYNQILQLNGKVGFFGGEPHTITITSTQEELHIILPKHAKQMIDKIEQCLHSKTLDATETITACITIAQKALTLKKAGLFYRLHERKPETQRFYEQISKLENPTPQSSKSDENLVQSTLS